MHLHELQCPPGRAHAPTRAALVPRARARARSFGLCPPGWLSFGVLRAHQGGSRSAVGPLAHVFTSHAPRAHATSRPGSDGPCPARPHRAQNACDAAHLASRPAAAGPPTVAAISVALRRALPLAASASAAGATSAPRSNAWHSVPRVTHGSQCGMPHRGALSFELGAAMPKAGIPWASLLPPASSRRAGLCAFQS